MMNIAVFCSGSGSNFQAIAESINKGHIKDAKIVVMVTDVAGCFAAERAKKLGIETFLVEKKNSKTREEFEKAIIKELDKRNVDLIVLAGYMRLLSVSFVKKFKNKILKQC